MIKAPATAITRATAMPIPTAAIATLMPPMWPAISATTAITRTTG
jgi:hypothetical protein